MVLCALQWLLANNKYYRSVRVNLEALAMLPEDEDLSGLHSVTLNSTEEAAESQPTQEEDEDSCNTHLSGSFVPSNAQRMTDHQTVSGRSTDLPATSGSTYSLVASQ